MDEPMTLPVLAYDAGGEIRIEAVGQIGGGVLWRVAINGCVMNRAGAWEYEPLPSSRDAAFMARCRFATPQSAYECLIAATQAVAAADLERQAATAAAAVTEEVR